DGIRDGHVTGVQTCALPICPGSRAGGSAEASGTRFRGASRGSPRGPGGRASGSAESSSGAARQQTLRSGSGRGAPSGRGKQEREIGRASCRERGEGSGGGGV